MLRSLKAKDGVYSILGNHDYSYYVDADPDEQVEIEKRVQDFERSLGWQLLNNEHRVVYRGQDSIYIAGTEIMINRSGQVWRNHLHPSNREILS